MKKMIVFLVLTALALSFTSCKKEPPNTPDSRANYSQLRAGNYWVYERYEMDTLGNETPLGIIDTCRVEKDTLINGKKYFKYVRPPYLSAETASFLRDSLHYVVTHTGRIIFSSSKFNEVFRTFNHVDYDIEEWMTEKNFVILVPAGTFITSNFQLIFHMAEGLQFYGSKRYMNYRYAKNVGIVSETLPIMVVNPNQIERRLIDYHLVD